jgi:hypothetical protein
MASRMPIRRSISLWTLLEPKLGSSSHSLPSRSTPLLRPMYAPCQIAWGCGGTTHIESQCEDEGAQCNGGEDHRHRHVDREWPGPLLGTSIGLEPFCESGEAPDARSHHWCRQ